jgi:CheY-like chemotaxis protein
MNLFGNSLKYTKYGFIQVKLEGQDVQSSQGSTADTSITISVTDTGQGISPEYLRTKLFTAFAQEDSLTPGTGLGLSLVKSLVDMLSGEITIDSTLGEGTKVTVRLPMTKGTPAGSRNGSSSTPTSTGSMIERVKDDSIDRVRAQASDRTVSIFKNEACNDRDEGGEATQLMHKSLAAYLEHWYGFRVQKCHAWDGACNDLDIVVVEETDFQEFATAAPQLLLPTSKTMILVLCNTASAQSMRDFGLNIEQIRYPFGPYKLARALRLCLERLVVIQGKYLGNESTTIDPTFQSRPLPSVEEVINVVESITLSTTDPESRDIPVIQSGSFAANEDSMNAQMAMSHSGSFQVSSASIHSEGKTEFPFPKDADPLVDGTISPSVKQQLMTTRPAMGPARRTISATRQEMILRDVIDTNPMSSRGAIANVPPEPPKTVTRAPRMLLVDDNRINLKLLQTFMKKRKYTEVTNAEDGLEAVNAYSSLLRKAPPEPPDIILMDISMPIMNGFEATRKIRELEREYREQLPPMETPPSCLIIALTGLASGRDQSEAFTCGFDLYITKPVSFAEISRLLDNWEKNGGVAGAEGVPHGAAVPSSDSVEDLTLRSTAPSLPA